MNHRSDMRVRIGTSGWVYKHWRGLFYPKELPQRGWFHFYANTFDTVEINNTFYRLPSAGTFDEWQNQAPSGFLYAVKASRYLTHMKKLKDPEEPLRRFFAAANHLKSKLGPVLYQLPPNWRLDLDRFDHFLRALPKAGRAVIEFRDPSWLVDDIYQLMERRGVAHCIHDMKPLDVPSRVTGRIAYVRFHGDADHGGDYGSSILEECAGRIAEWRKAGLEVFVYFNNDVEGYAIKNALSLKEMVACDSSSAN